MTVVPKTPWCKDISSGVEKLASRRQVVAKDSVQERIRPRDLSEALLSW